MPPTRTTILGPNRATSHPSTGTSQASVRTKMLNATWIAGRHQWNLLSIGRTNKVHPYCRLAIITMQMMPTTSWTGRTDAVGAVALALLVGISQILPRIDFVILSARY